MSSAAIIGEEIDRQAELASAALRSLAGAGAQPRSGSALALGVLDMLRPYSVARYIADRVVQSPSFNPELAQAVHSKLVPLAGMAGEMLGAARQRGYFEDPDAREPLLWLEACDQEVNDCMVALESMLDPELDSLMSGALDEHRRDETVKLDSVL